MNSNIKKRSLLAFVACLWCAIGLVGSAPAQEKLSVNGRQWNYLPKLELKFNSVNGLDEYVSTSGFILRNGKLSPSLGQADDISVHKSFQRSWDHEFVKSFGSMEVTQRLLILTVPGLGEDWGKDKSVGDAIRVQSLCGALMEYGAGKGFSPIPNEKLKWTKIGGQSAVEFTYTGTLSRAGGPQYDVPFFATGWALDFPGDDLVFLFSGPDSSEQTFKDASKTIKRVADKVKAVTEKEKAKILKELNDLARGKMKARSWEYPHRSIGYLSWLSTPSLPADVNQSLTIASAWLIKQQLDGHWETPDQAQRTQVGVTALAGRALIGANIYLQDPNIESALEKATLWMLKQQNEDGVLGKVSGNSTPYNHAIASAFLLDRYESTRSSTAALAAEVQKALDFIMATQDIGGAWDYEITETDSLKCDPSITFWNILALYRGLECGFKVDPERLKRARVAMLSMAGPDGKVGYFEPGGDVARTADGGPKFPWHKSESLTGAALYSTLLVDSMFYDAKIPSAFHWHATRRILNAPPTMDPEAFDIYYWQAASCGAAIMGGQEAKEWKLALNHILLTWQLDDDRGSNYGAWPAESVWSAEGGQAYTTAMAMLALLNANSKAIPYLVAESSEPPAQQSGVED